jgi:hypothetical protein
VPSPIYGITLDDVSSTDEMFAWISSMLQLNLPPEQRDLANEQLRLGLKGPMIQTLNQAILSGP